ncbi:protein ASPARTIC PROTEASE IN GUARD CELL 1-like [Gossypium australe]|uniref:Protein ASPARTIC PROTEASE IN GUARD CELL 1-like n=1 Tax=Gossypium australe TaxID=47621 RepID=A0A5B6UYF3_9ROSI|nr:protein ASPARTIC PROTEASE IN GUARD CELL 1-like [Gossypium australe]
MHRLEYMAKNDDVIQIHSASIRALENQVGQIANTLNSRPQGAFPSDTKNLKTQGKEQCKTITLRSGTQLDEVVQDGTKEDDKSSHNQEMI